MHGEPEFSQNKAQGDGVHGEEHVQATVCSWKSNRLTLPIMRCEVGVVSLSDFSTVYFYRGSFLVQSVGKQAAGREVGRGTAGQTRLLGEGTGHSPPAGMEQQAEEMELQEKKKNDVSQTQMAQILILAGERSKGRQRSRRRRK